MANKVLIVDDDDAVLTMLYKVIKSNGIDMTEFVAPCLKNKLAIVPGTAFCPDENGTSNSVRFNYSTPSDEQIERGCVILGEVAREMISEIK